MKAKRPARVRARQHEELCARKTHPSERLRCRSAARQRPERLAAGQGAPLGAHGKTPLCSVTKLAHVPKSGQQRRFALLQTAFRPHE